jgi:hypothetical protein
MEKPLPFAEKPLFFAEKPLFFVEKPLFLMEKPLFFAEKPLFLMEKPLFLMNKQSRKKTKIQTLILSLFGLFGLFGLLSLGGTELHRTGHIQNRTVQGINAGDTQKMEDYNINCLHPFLHQYTSLIIKLWILKI